MLEQWVNRNRGPIGLHLGTRAVRLVQLDRVVSKAGQRARVLAAAWDTLPEDLPTDLVARHEAMASVIKPMLEHGGFYGRRVVSCLPSNGVIYKNIRMPQMSMSELRTAVEWEARDRLQLGDVSHDLQFVAAGEVRQGEEVREEVIVLAAPTSAIEAHVDLLERCGLEPTAIDAIPTALARCVFDCENRSDGGDGTHIVIYMGYAASSVLIVNDGRVTFFRVIDIGGEKLDEAIGKKLKMSQEEAWALRTGQTQNETTRQAVDDAQRGVIGELSREIGLCLRYHSVTFRGIRPSCAILVGTHTVSGELMGQMAGEVDVSIEHGLAIPRVDERSLGVLEVAEFAKGSMGAISTSEDGGLAGQLVGEEGSSVSSGSSISSWAVAMGLALRSDMRSSKRGAA